MRPNKIALLFLSLTMALGITSCDEPKMIEADEMEKIITDILLTDGVINSINKSSFNGIPADSINFYQPIIEQYDHSIADFRYTIYNMSTRKSNPLNDIMGRVVKRLEQQAFEANYRYQAGQRFDTLSLKAFTDTIYRRDTLFVGALNKVRIKIDSNIAPGDYTITLSHKSMPDFRFSQKAIRHYLANKGDKKLPFNTTWINRSDTLSKFTTKFSTLQKFDSLIIFFYEQKPVKSASDHSPIPRDSSVLGQIIVTHAPAIEIARQKYYQQLLVSYFPTFSYYEPKKDSLPTHIELVGRINRGRDSIVRQR